MTHQVLSWGTLLTLFAGGPLRPSVLLLNLYVVLPQSSSLLPHHSAALLLGPNKNIAPSQSHSIPGRHGSAAESHRGHSMPLSSQFSK